jgi:hypothetical protein
MAIGLNRGGARVLLDDFHHGSGSPLNRMAIL